MHNADSAGPQTSSAEIKADKPSGDNNQNMKALFSLIQTMNVACRNLSAYPPEHPAIVQSFEKVEQNFINLLDNHNHVTIQSVCWLFCWATTGINSDEIAKVCKASFNEIFNHDYVWLDKNQPLELARKWRYARPKGFDI